MKIITVYNVNGVLQSNLFLSTIFYTWKLCMDKKLPRILHLYPGPIYDAQSQFGSKYEALSKYFTGDILSISDTTKSETFDNFTLHLFKPLTEFTFLLFFQFLIKSLHLASKNKYNLIVCYDPLKTGLIGVILKAFFKSKLIIEVNGTYHAAQLYEGRGWKAQLKGKVFPKIQKFTLQFANSIKCLYAQQIESLDLDVPTWTYSSYTDIASKPYIATSNKTIMSIGFPAYIKGLDILITAFKTISLQAPGWKLVLIGHLKDDMSMLQKLSSGNLLIEIRNPVSFDKIPATIDQADIFVLASRSEAMGRVLVEAMARSKPRLASRVGGIPTVINEEEDGLLFESGNAEELAKQLSRLIKDETLRQKLAINANVRFNKEFTLDVYIEKTKNLYFDVLKNR